MNEEYDTVFWEMCAPLESAHEPRNPVDTLAAHLSKTRIAFAVDECHITREEALTDEDPSIREKMESPPYARSAGIALFQFLAAESDCSPLRRECEAWIKSIENQGTKQCGPSAS